MKLVIDIHEKDYQSILNSGQVPYGVVCAIMNGTPLPKVHGRLIDADKIQFENAEFDTYGDYSRAFDAIDYAPTIIGADGGGEDEG